MFQLGGKNPGIIFADADLDKCIPTTIRFVNGLCMFIYVYRVRQDTPKKIKLCTVCCDFYYIRLYCISLYCAYIFAACIGIVHRASASGVRNKRTYLLTFFSFNTFFVRIANCKLLNEQLD